MHSAFGAGAISGTEQEPAGLKAKTDWTQAFEGCPRHEEAQEQGGGQSSDHELMDNVRGLCGQGALRRALCRDRASEQGVLALRLRLRAPGPHGARRPLATKQYEKCGLDGVLSWKGRSSVGANILGLPYGGRCC